MLAVPSQIIIRAVGDPPQFAPSKREQIFNIGRRFGIERQFLLGMIAQAHVVLCHAERQQPVFTEAAPILEPLQIRIRLAEKFQLHLFKFTDAENKIAGRDFIAEALADLTDAERHLFARGALNVHKVDKDPLRRFRAQI